MQLSNYIENEDRSNSQGNDEVNSREILDSFKRRQEMQAYAICQGVTARSNVNHNHSIKSHRQNARHMSYLFHPVSEKSGKVNNLKLELLG